MDVDIDNDFDAKLLDQFRSMGTTDRDVLIAEFQAVVGNNQINPDLCAFFLDMNDWNLQNAVCSYYDIEQPSTPLPSMSFLGDVTLGDGESVAPNTNFVKTWKIKNPGMDRWPPGCHIRYCSGDNLASVERRMVNALAPGEEMDLSVEMRSPSLVGSYLSLWRLSTPTGVYFGDVFNVHIVVAEGGLLGLTQQLARIGGNTCQLSTPPHDQHNISHATGSMDTAVLLQQQILPYERTISPPLMQEAAANPIGFGGPSSAVEEDAEMS